MMRTAVLGVLAFLLLAGIVPPVVDGLPVPWDGLVGSVAILLGTGAAIERSRTAAL